jgi:hypothetical protein
MMPNFKGRRETSALEGMWQCFVRAYGTGTMALIIY